MEIAVLGCPRLVVRVPPLSMSYASDVPYEYWRSNSLAISGMVPYRAATIPDGGFEYAVPRLSMQWTPPVPTPESSRVPLIPINACPGCGARSWDRSQVPIRCQYCKNAYAGPVEVVGRAS